MQLADLSQSLKGQCQYHALIGLSQTTRSTGGFDSLNRFGVDVPYRKHDFAWFFAALMPKFLRLKLWMLFEKKRYGTGFELKHRTKFMDFERIPIPLQRIR